MADKNKTKEVIKSTQSFLSISEIRSDTIIMDSGNYLAVVAVSSTNFSLKSQEEQDALIFGYQNFVNSLDFPIQILMQSRKMDIHNYIEKVKNIMEQQTNELLRVQTAEYIEFITKLIENASIMNKSFYVVVPYLPPYIKGSGSGGGFLSGLFGGKPNVAAQAASSIKDFEENRLKLAQRVNTVVAGLSALGLRSIQLGTEELTELLYNSYNFDAGPLFDAGNINQIKIQS